MQGLALGKLRHLSDAAEERKRRVTVCGSAVASGSGQCALVVDDEWHPIAMEGAWGACSSRA